MLVDSSPELKEDALSLNSFAGAKGSELEEEGERAGAGVSSLEEAFLTMGGELVFAGSSVDSGFDSSPEGTVDKSSLEDLISTGEGDSGDLSPDEYKAFLA